MKTLSEFLFILRNNLSSLSTLRALADWSSSQKTLDQYGQKPRDPNIWQRIFGTSLRGIVSLHYPRICFAFRCCRTLHRQLAFLTFFSCTLADHRCICMNKVWRLFAGMILRNIVSVTYIFAVKKSSIDIITISPFFRDQVPKFSLQFGPTVDTRRSHWLIHWLCFPIDLSG